MGTVTDFDPVHHEYEQAMGYLDELGVPRREAAPNDYRGLELRAGEGSWPEVVLSLKGRIARLERRVRAAG